MTERITIAAQMFSEILFKKRKYEKILCIVNCVTAPLFWVGPRGLQFRVWQIGVTNLHDEQIRNLCTPHNIIA